MIWKMTISPNTTAKYNSQNQYQIKQYIAVCLISKGRFNYKKAKSLTYGGIMLLNWAAWNWDDIPLAVCWPPLSLCWGAVGGSLSLASLFSLPSPAEGFPASSESPEGDGVPRPTPNSSEGLPSVSEGPGAMFKFLPPPSRQLPTSEW